MDYIYMYKTRLYVLIGSAHNEKSS